MIALDANVLVRLLTRDDPDQFRRVQRCLEAAKDRDEPLFLNHIVLCECIWVLSYSYGFPKSALVDVLDRLLATKQFVIEDKPAVWAAVADYRASQADFADCLIGVKNRNVGCETTVTLDQGTTNLSTFRRL
ncbi:MAG: type II toxin-antitoxin system VapC family toxin [Nitrospira sp.]